MKIPFQFIFLQDDVAVRLEDLLKFVSANPTEPAINLVVKIIEAYKVSYKKAHDSANRPLLEKWKNQPKTTEKIT